MGPEVIAAIIGAIASIVTTGVGLGVSAGEQEKTNAENVNLANSQFTRAKADAVQAGFSPLVATGINPSNVVVGSNSSNTASLFGSLGSELNAHALGVSSMEHQSKENELDRVKDLLMQDRDFKNARENLILTLNNQRDLAHIDANCKMAIADMQKKTAEAGQKMQIEQWNKENVLKRQIASADVAKWAKEYERRNREDNRSLGEYIFDHILARIAPTSGEVLNFAGSVMGKGK